MTLSQAAFGTRTLTTQLMMVIFGSLFLALISQVEVPMFPVPMSLQTLGITLIGLTFGARLAAVTILVYLAQGAAGLPVLSGGDAGLVHFSGPTAGYLWGFVVMAFLTGWLVERGLDRGFGRLFIAALVPAMLLYVPGAGWLMAGFGMDADAAFAAGVAPFVLGDVVKSALAAAAVTGSWAMLKARRR